MYNTYLQILNVIFHFSTQAESFKFVDLKGYGAQYRNVYRSTNQIVVYRIYLHLPIRHTVGGQCTEG